MRYIKFKNIGVLFVLMLSIKFYHADGQNLAAGKSISATNTYSAGSAATKANDSDYNTYWAASSSYVNPSITVSLGAAYPVTLISLQFNNVKSYFIEGSNGGSTYTQIATMSSITNEYQSHQFSSTTYTHIRVTLTSYLYVAPLFGINELEVYTNPPPPTYIDKIQSNGTKPLIINLTNNVGIGTTNPGSFKLAVEGKIGAREVNVTNASPWPDYVFENSYNLPDLDDVKKFIQKNKHLPEISSAGLIEKEGIDLGNMNILLVKKIEELTLYSIKLNEEIKSVKEANEMLRNRLDELEKKLIYKD